MDSTWSLLVLLQDPLRYQLFSKHLKQPLGWAGLGSSTGLAQTQKILCGKTDLMMVESRPSP